jgi:TRAP-type C4-dicarboxylate transport system permease small subunit
MLLTLSPCTAGRGPFESPPMSQSPTEHHTPISTDEITKTFDEVIVPVDLSQYGIEDWLTFAIFWVMCASVFLQFFTRYVLNNSFGWTEEIAIYCLIGVVFLGSVMCVRQSRHIHVDFLYRYFSPSIARAMATFVDLVRIGLFSYLAFLVWRYSSIISDERMTTIDFPKMPIFMIVFAAFVLMAVRSVQVLVENIQRGYSVLERPGAFDGSQEG